MSRTTDRIRRRTVLGALAAGAGIVTTRSIPDKWTGPVVQSVLLPAHAQASPSGAVYAVEGVFAEGFADCESLTVCAVLNGDTAQVRHQPIWDSTEGPVSYLFRTGTIPTDGSPGNMVVTGAAPGCEVGPDRPATITNLTENSLTYTLDRPNNLPLVAMLFRVDTCPDFAPLDNDCVIDCPD